MGVRKLRPLAAALALIALSSLSAVMADEVTVDMGYLDRAVNGRQAHRRPRSVPPDKVPHRRVVVQADDIIAISCPGVRYPSDNYGWLEYHAAVSGSGCLLPVLRKQVPHIDYFQAREPGRQTIVVGLKQSGQAAIQPSSYVDVIVSPVVKRDADQGGAGTAANPGSIKTYGGHYDNPKVKNWGNGVNSGPGFSSGNHSKNSFKSYEWNSVPPK